MEDLFYVGDRVFDIRHGWGDIIECIKGDYLVKFHSSNLPMLYNKIGILMLSFTEYTLEGFSQQRPEPLPKPGDIVWVRDKEYENWLITHFRKIGGDQFKYGTSTRNSGDSANYLYYKYLTTTNPYANEQ